MSRAFFVVALALALEPKACAKAAKSNPPAEVEPPPLPMPATSATTPPIWHPPEPATPATPVASTSATPAVSPDLLKARAAAEAKDFKKVKALLEKKVRAGKCLPEEAQLVFKACVATKDKACSDAVKAKHPDDITE